MTIRRLCAALIGLLVIVPVLTVWRQTLVTPPLQAITVVLLALSAFSPVGGLSVLVGVLPIAPLVGAITGASVSSPAELLVAAFVTGAGAHVIVAREDAPGRLPWPACLFAVVVLASAAVGLAEEQQATAWAPTYLALLGRHLVTDYFADPASFPALHHAMPWIEGLALTVLAEHLLITRPHERGQVIRLLVVGAAAGAFWSGVRLAEVALRFPAPLDAAVTFLATARASPFYQDVNAAGSLFALFLVATLWAGWRGRWRWWLASAPLTLALWLTKSRTAFVGVVAGLLVAWAAERRPSLRILTIGGLLGILVAGLLFINTGRRSHEAPRAFLIRVKLAEVSLRMWAGDPVFGVGIGQFQERSAAFIRPDLVAIFPTSARGENAHNNFLQVLTELGVVGFASFLWLLGAPARAVAAVVGARRQTPMVVGLAGGITAFLFSCLAGHPLLTEPVLLAFLLALGVASGLGIAAGPTSPPLSRRSIWLVAVAAALIVASVPIRMVLARRAADLDHVVIGVSRVAGTMDGVDYRLAEPSSVWFVSSDSRVVHLPIRLTAGSGACQLEVSLDGRAGDVVELSRIAWQTVKIPLPAPPRGLVSRRLDLHVRGDACHLMVGRLVEQK